MPFIEVLSPSGHRDKVEVSQNTIMMTILEDICNKRGLNSDNCYLSYNKNKIDLSLKFGTSKLLNNAKIDLIESPTSLVDQATVDVVLQLPESTRLNGTFSSNESIFTIMEKFAEVQPNFRSIIFTPEKDFTAVVVYLHEQIIGEYCLRNTTLSSLGLRTGRVLFHLEYKNIADKDRIICEEVVRSRIAKSLKAEELRRNKEMSVATKVNVVDNYVTQEEVRINPPYVMMNDDDAFNFTPFSAFSNQSRSIFDGVNPEERRNVPQQRKSQTLGEILGIHLDQDPSNVSEPQPFLNFKFPTNTNINEEGLEKKRQPPQSKLEDLEDRDTVLYYPNPAQYASSHEDVSDSFFELTEQDARTILQGYRAISAAENPLLTNTMRDQMKEEKFSKYQSCIIQFTFQDTYIMQSVFKPKETVEDLYNYVKNFFKNKSSTFVLYMSPAKVVLKDKSLSLIQAGLVPRSKLYVSVKAADLCKNVDQLLSGDEAKARQVIEKWMKRDPEEATVASNEQKVPKWLKRAH